MPDNNGILELYNKMYDAGLYSKSFSDFQSQYDNEEGMNKIYSNLSTKSFNGKKVLSLNEEEFKNKYYSHLKKKENLESPTQEASSQPSQSHLTLEKPRVSSQGYIFESPFSFKPEDKRFDVLERTLTDQSLAKQQEQDTYASDLFERLGAGTINLLEGTRKGLKWLDELTGIAGFNAAVPIKAASQFYDAFKETDTYKSALAKRDELLTNSQRYDETVADYVRRGEWNKAIGATFLGAAESLPMTMMAAAGGPAGLVSIGIMSGGEKYDSLEGKDMGIVKRNANALITGLSEIATEGIFGSYAYGQLIKDMFKSGGKEVVEEVVGNGLKSWYKQGMKRFGLLTAPMVQGTEEGVNGEVNYLTDILTGIDTFEPKRALDIFINNFAVGAGTGLGFSVAGVTAKLTKPASKVKQENDNIKSSLSDKIQIPDEEKDVYLSKLLKEIPEEYSESTKTKIAELLVKKDAIQRRADKVTEKTKPVYEKQIKGIDTAIADIMNEEEGLVEDKEKKGAQLTPKTPVEARSPKKGTKIPPKEENAPQVKLESEKEIKIGNQVLRGEDLDAYKELEKKYGEEKAMEMIEPLLEEQPVGEWTDKSAKEASERIEKQKITETLPLQETKPQENAIQIETPTELPKMEEAKAVQKVEEKVRTKDQTKETWEVGEERDFTFGPNSTTNEGRFRLKPPTSVNDYFQKGAYTIQGNKTDFISRNKFNKQTFPEGIRAVVGKTKDGTEQIQALRFNKKLWPEEKAKQWWNDNKDKYEFYQTETPSAEEVRVDLQPEGQQANLGEVAFKFNGEQRFGTVTKRGEDSAGPFMKVKDNTGVNQTIRPNSKFLTDVVEEPSKIKDIKDIISLVDEEIGKTRKEKLSEREQQVKNSIADRLEKLSGASFAINITEKNTQVARELIGLAKDLGELGIIKFEQGINHILEEIKKYLPHIDPENVDKYKDDIKMAFDIKEEGEIPLHQQTPPPTKNKPILNKEDIPDAVNTVDLSPEKWYDTFLRKIQNKYRRIDQLVDAAKKSGYSITDDINPSLKVELMDGKSIKKIRDKEQEIIHSKRKGEKSLIERMKKDGVDAEIIGNYLLAKHAPERNAKKMEERNKDIDDRIAKIKEKPESEANNKRIKILESEKIKQVEVDILNAKANKLIEKVNGLKNADKYKQYAEEAKERLVTARQNALVEYGLESQETINELNKVYKDYVPYKVLSRQAGKYGTTKAIEAKGKNVYKAKNLIDIEQIDRVNPIMQALHDYNMTVIKGEKNVTDQAFLKFAEEIPNDIMAVEKPKYRVSYNSDGEVVMQPDVLHNKELFDNAIELRVNGEPVFIRIKDTVLLRAIKGTGVQRSIRVLNQVNNWLRFVNTIYNPEFVLTNLTRDLQTAGININAESKKGLTRNFVKNILPAMRGIWQNEQGIKNTRWANIVEELKDTGGEVGWLNIGNIETEMSRVVDRFKNYNSNTTSAKLKSSLTAVGDFIESVNKTVEMASRVSAYEAAVELGVSREQAASLAKNLTVNFNKKGELGSLMDSFYLFANAGIQGSAILLKNVAKSKKVQVMVSGVVVGSFLMNLLNSYTNDDEYEKIDDGIKERNLIIMHPSGNYNKIPLPYGYNIFKILGDKIYNVAIKGKKPVNETLALFKSLFNTFNPISSSTLAQSISPTITDPLVQVSENKNWFGSPIKPEQNQYASKVPESQLYFGSVGDASKWASQKINSITGGTASKSGVIDISPEYIDHFFDFLAGGTGRFVINSIESGKELIKGEELEPNKLPFVRSFYGKTDEKMELGTVYKMKIDAWRKEFSEREKVKYRKALYSVYQKGLIEKEDYDAYLKDFDRGQWSISLSKQYPDLDRKELRDLMKELE